LFKRKKQRVSVLKQQKPKRRYLFKSVIKSIFFLGAVGSFCLTAFIYRLDVEKFWQNFFSLSIDSSWHVEIYDENKQKVSKELENRVYELIQLAHRGNVPLSLSKLAKFIQNRIYQSSVHLFLSGQHQLILTVTSYKPYLRILADIPRYVTKNGQIYGNDSMKDDRSTLIGIFPSGYIWKFHEDQSLRLESREHKLVLEAISLFQFLRKENLDIEKIFFRKFQGFSFNIRSYDTVILVGRRPFNQKLKNLANMLKKFNHQLTDIARIDLDYQGKIFIKKRETHL